VKSHRYSLIKRFRSFLFRKQLGLPGLVVLTGLVVGQVIEFWLLWSGIIVVRPKEHINKSNDLESCDLATLPCSVGNRLSTVFLLCIFFPYQYILFLERILDKNVYLLGNC